MGRLGSIVDLEQHKLISNMFAPNSCCGQLANQQELADLDYSNLLLMGLVGVQESRNFLWPKCRNGMLSFLSHFIIKKKGETPSLNGRNCRVILQKT